MEPTLDTLAQALFALQSPNNDPAIVRPPHKYWGKQFEGYGHLRFNNEGTSKETIPQGYNQPQPGRRTDTGGYAGSDWYQQKLAEIAQMLSQPPRGGAGKRGF